LTYIKIKMNRGSPTENPGRLHRVEGVTSEWP